LQREHQKLTRRIQEAEHTISDLQDQNGVLARQAAAERERAEKAQQALDQAQQDLGTSRKRLGRAEQDLRQVEGNLERQRREMEARLKKLQEELQEYLEQDVRSSVPAIGKGAWEELMWKLGPGKKFISGRVGEIMAGVPVLEGLGATMSWKLRADGARIAAIKEEIAEICRTLKREAPKYRETRAERLARSYRCVE
jgi:DNA repair exonuclease SbcCD ATPase subunit